MKMKELLHQTELDKNTFSDLHMLRFYSSFITVSKGKVIRVTSPGLAYCPLANFLYGEIRRSKALDPEAMAKVIKRIVEEKMSEFGFFTGKREFFNAGIAIPYGASEMLMYAMRKKIIDAAVVVCDGAGTVIVNQPEIVQGIGARMNGIFFTSPVPGIIKKLKKTGSHVVFQDARIDQIKGVEKAALLGHKNIAVTINGCMEERLERLKEIEKNHDVSVTSLVVCTTGASDGRIQEIRKYGDIVWSCASEEIRKIIGEKAVLQLSKKIPVFVLTRKGLILASGYCSNGQLIKKLDIAKQYIISSTCKGREIRMGNFKACLSEIKLPIRSAKEPRFSAPKPTGAFFKR